MSQPLSPNEWHRLEPLLDAVLEARPDERDAVVAELSGGDPATRAQLEQLAAEFDRTDRLLEQPAAERFAELFDDSTDAFADSIAGRYCVIRRVGQGGMAIVFLARDLRHSRDVAIKVVRQELAAWLGDARFLREIEIAAQLRHPHIVPLYDSGEVNGALYYVMPYEEGRSLRDRLTHDGPLPIEEATVVLRDICDALAYAHRHGVVHRDIKPGNVLLSGQHALVTDFGIARAVTEAAAREALTMPGVVVGTPAYMAPEQGIPGSLADHRADIYSFGVLAYEVLTGRRPNHGQPVDLTSALQASTAHGGAGLAHLGGVIMKCIETDPGARWQSTDELLKQLERADLPRDAAVSAPRAPPRWRSTTRVAIALTVAAGLAGATWQIIHREAAVDLGRVAVMRFRNETNADSLTSFGAMLADAIANSLARSGIADVVPAMSITSRASTSDSSTSSDLQSLARETGAGLIIGGSYTLSGDSLTITPEILDVRQRGSLGPIESVTVPRTERQRGLLAVRQRVAVAIAGRLNPQIAESALFRKLPMSPEAYNEYAVGLELYYAGDSQRALEHLYRAIQLDSTSASATLQAAEVEWAVSWNLLKVDSLLRRAYLLRRDMPAYDLAHYEWLRAYLDGDLEGVLRVARRRLDLEGGAVVQAAMRLNRLDEAYEMMQTRIGLPFFGRMVVAWEFWTQVLHMRGEHGRELTEARKSVATFRSTGSEFARINALTFEIRALASLGHLSEVKSRLEELHEIRPTSEAFVSAARELRWHGYPDAATEVGRLAAQWYQETVRRSPTRPMKILLGRSLAELGEWDRARPIFQELAAEPFGETFTPDQAQGFDLVPLGYLGIDGARRGDTLAAEGMIDRLGRLDRPYRRGAPMYWQARIAAQLGSCERTVGFLRQAMQAGESVYDAERYELLLEVAEFRRIADCAAYQRFIAPKG